MDHNDALSVLVMENRERITSLEGSHTDLSDKVDKLIELTKELHADMVGRKAVLGVAGTLTKYGVWILAGLGSAFGISQSSNVMQWLHTFPSGGH